MCTEKTWDMWHCCRRSLFWTRKQSNGIPFSWSVFFLQMLLWAHCSSFGASRCDSKHGRMCLSKMHFYYLYAGFGTAWVPETMGWNLGTDQDESDPASYWCLKAGNLLKTQGRDTENWEDGRFVFSFRSSDDMLIFPCGPGRLVDYSRTFILDGAAVDDLAHVVDSWSARIAALLALSMVWKNPVNLSETPRLGWWKIWKVQPVRVLVWKC